MEEKIESKMTEVVEYILTKPKETITADEYMILASELKDARFRLEIGSTNFWLQLFLLLTFLK